MGGLLQPGGSYLDDKRSPVYILQPDDAPDAFNDGVKGMIEVLKRVMQRYKYLQKPLEENFLPGVLSYLPKWDVRSREKLAEATALLTIELQISSRCLQSLAKEHVVKDNVSLNFLTAFIKTYLSRQSIDQFGSTLRRSGLKSILAVFPLQIRDRKHLEAHFKEENLQVVNDWYAKLALGEIKDETVQAVERMINDDETSDQVCSDVFIEKGLPELMRGRSLRPSSYNSLKGQYPKWTSLNGSGSLSWVLWIGLLVLTKLTLLLFPTSP